MKVLRLLFGLSATVSRRAYLVAGVSLMALKLAIDNAIAYAATGRLWPVLAYLTPSVALKQEFAGPWPEWMLIAMAVVALPFIWIGVTMSVRRAADAGKSPFVGMLFLVPVVNYIVMIVLATVRSAEGGTRWTPPAAVYRAPAVRPAEPAPNSLPRRPMDPAARATLLGMLSSVTIGISMIGISIYSMELYGAALFLGTPFLMGVITAFSYNHGTRRPLGSTVFMALLSVIITGSVVLLFAVEGLICLLMALPIAGALATLGAIVGWAVAQQASARPGHAAAAVLFLPGFAGAEHRLAAPEPHEVATAIEIDAPPERVWPNVIGFSELPPPPESFFRLGIAYPVRARIEGEGIGAVRRCEFSTGPFVEPITAWEPPRRLAFDVSAQPPSMTELSPWKNVKAAHLEGYMVSRRGEFRLVALPGGRTRLEGSTWYTLSIYPESYWTVWSEALLHAIHGRVLGHIKTLSER